MAGFCIPNPGGRGSPGGGNGNPGRGPGRRHPACITTNAAHNINPILPRVKRRIAAVLELVVRVFISRCDFITQPLPGLIEPVLQVIKAFLGSRLHAVPGRFG